MFLDSDGATSSAKSKSDVLFQPDQCEIMLQYYDQYNAFTPEGLLAWQNYALEKVAGNQLKILREKSFLKISKAAQEEVQEAINKEKKTALSVDVGHNLYTSLQVIAHMYMYSSQTETVKNL